MKQTLINRLAALEQKIISVQPIKIIMERDVPQPDIDFIRIKVLKPVRPDLIKVTRGSSDQG